MINIFSAKLEEDVKNHSICIYDANTETVKNIESEFDIIKSVCVFVDIVPVFEGLIPETIIIKKGTYVRCKRVSIIMQ